MRVNPDHRVKSEVPIRRMLCKATCGWAGVGLLAVCIFAPNALAQAQKKAVSTPAAPAPVAAHKAPSNRFLFIVDTSKAMERHRQEEVQVVDDILTSSASGQLHAGDTIGVWTFNTNIYTGNLPLQTWAPEDKDELILVSKEFLRQQKYANQSRFDSILPGMYEVIKHSDLITIFIISNGAGKMQGSPFDQEINGLYQDALKQMKKSPMPVVTVLEAKAGKVINYTVNAVPWPVVIPALPIPIKVPDATPTVPAVTQASPTNSPPATVAPVVAQTATAIPPAQNPPPPLPLAVTAPSTRVAPVNPPAATPVNPVPSPDLMTAKVDSQPVTTTPPPANPVKVDDNATQTPAMKSTTTMIPSVPAPLNVRVGQKPNVSPPQEHAAIPPKPPTLSQPVAAPVETAQAKPAVTEPPAPEAPKGFLGHISAMISDSGNRKWLLIGGGGLVVVALGLVWLMVRRTRPPARISLISQTMHDPPD